MIAHSWFSNAKRWLSNVTRSGTDSTVPDDEAFYWGFDLNGSTNSPTIDSGDWGFGNHYPKRARRTGRSNTSSVCPDPRSEELAHTILDLMPKFSAPLHQRQSRPDIDARHQRLEGGQHPTSLRWVHRIQRLRGHSARNSGAQYRTRL